MLIIVVLPLAVHQIINCKKRFQRSRIDAPLLKYNLESNEIFLRKYVDIFLEDV